jgi:hypothetical protein
MEGHGSVLPIRKEDILAYPGSFTSNKNSACLPLEERARTIETLEGGSDPYLRILNEGVRNVLKAVLAQPSNGCSVGLAITHDAVIAPVLTYLTGDKYDQMGRWIDPLDGFALVKTIGSWKVISHGNIRDVTSLMP